MHLGPTYCPDEHNLTFTLNLKIGTTNHVIEVSSKRNADRRYDLGDEGLKSKLRRVRDRLKKRGHWWGERLQGVWLEVVEN